MDRSLPQLNALRPANGFLLAAVPVKRRHHPHSAHRGHRFLLNALKLPGSFAEWVKLCNLCYQ
jgi:hypothetical protein